MKIMKFVAGITVYRIYLDRKPRYPNAWPMHRILINCKTPIEAWMDVRAINTAHDWKTIHYYDYAEMTDFKYFKERDDTVAILLPEQDETEPSLLGFVAMRADCIFITEDDLIL